MAVNIGQKRLVQFDSNFIRLVTKSEPGAVAIGQGLNGKMDASSLPTGVVQSTSQAKSTAQG